MLAAPPYGIFLSHLDLRTTDSVHCNTLRRRSVDQFWLMANLAFLTLLCGSELLSVQITESYLVTSLRSAVSPATVAGPVARRIGVSIGYHSIFSSHPAQPALCTPCSFCHLCPWSRLLLSRK